MKIESVLKNFWSLILKFTIPKYTLLFLNFEIYIVHVINCEWSRSVNFFHYICFVCNTNMYFSITCSLSIRCIPASSFFSNGYWPFFFPFILFISLILHIPSNFLTSIFSLRNPLSLSLILPHNLILSSHTLSFEILSLSQIRSSSPMIPKSKTKKTSYVLSNDAFNLSH